MIARRDAEVYTPEGSIDLVTLEKVSSSRVFRSIHDGTYALAGLEMNL